MQPTYPTTMSFNPNIHHRKSIRLKGYDYSQAGLYFITICVHDRKCLFGKIENDEMVLNDFGRIADECWLGIPKHFPNAVLHEHIVMPNHIHGIVELTQNDVSNVGAENFLPLQPPNEFPANEWSRNRFQKMIPRSIGSIVKGFKIGVTKWSRTNPVEAENFLPYTAERMRVYFPFTSHCRLFSSRNDHSLRLPVPAVKS